MPRCLNRWRGYLFTKGDMYMSKQNKTILSCLKKVLGVDEGKTIENV